MGLADPRADFLAARHVCSPLVAKTVAQSSPAGGRVVRVGKSRPRRVRVAPRDAPPPPTESAWPTSTDQWCWHCCHPVPGQPLPMPIKYDDKRQIFEVVGTFCSWACMKSFNLDSSSYKKSVNANNITLFHKRWTGVLRGIRPAPPRQALAVFGGTMTIAEFRAASDAPVEYNVLPPRMIVHRHTIHETPAGPGATGVRPPDKKRADLGAAVNFGDVSTKNETLRLKRPKPLHSSRNLLERTMGLGALTGSAP